VVRAAANRLRSPPRSGIRAREAEVGRATRNRRRYRRAVLIEPLFGTPQAGGNSLALVQAICRRSASGRFFLVNLDPLSLEGEGREDVAILMTCGILS
jgi:hypothetical protein